MHFLIFRMITNTNKGKPNMSILQNFKDTDHTFEKKFFKVIVFFAIALLVCFLIFTLLDKNEEVKSLFLHNSRLLKIFLFTGLGLSVFSFTAYYGSLNFWEEENEESLSASLLSSLFWAIFWICWGIYCAWLTINFDPLTTAVKLAIAGLVVIPSATTFFISHSIRKEMLQQQQEDKVSLNQTKNSEPGILATGREYFSGYFGLLCFPVYIVSLVILQFL